MGLNARFRLIMNTSIQVPDVIEQSLALVESRGKDKEDINLILARDCNPLSLESFFFRASP